MGQDKRDTLPEMTYICMYTLMDHVDQLSQASTNSHELTPTGGGVTYRMGRDGTKRDTFAELAYILKIFLGTTTKCSSLKGLRTINVQVYCKTVENQCVSPTSRMGAVLTQAVFWNMC